MANFYQKDTKTLRIVLANPNPIPIAVKVLRGLASSVAPYEWALPPQTDIVTVPASGQSAPIDMTINFSTVAPGQYWGWAAITVADTGEQLGNFVTEDTYVLGEAVSLVEIIWV